MRPEIEFRQEPETDNPAEIQVSMSDICEGGLGTTRPLDIAEIARVYIGADRPETSAAFPASQEIVKGSNPEFTNNSQFTLVWSLIQMTAGVVLICLANVDCPAGSVKCGGDSPRRACIYAYMLCNYGQNDCGNGWDEMSHTCG